jgi:large subunit ribosomal protein L18
MDHAKAIRRQRQRRSYRVRKYTRGVADRPRLCVTRSHRNITAPVIDDLAGKTLVSASTADKDLAKKIKYGGNAAAAEAIGKEIAERAIKAGITQVCFDRGASKYHGRMAALANAARAGGLKF